MPQQRQQQQQLLLLPIQVSMLKRDALTKDAWYEQKPNIFLYGTLIGINADEEKNNRNWETGFRFELHFSIKFVQKQLTTNQAQNASFVIQWWMGGGLGASVNDNSQRRWEYGMRNQSRHEVFEHSIKIFAFQVRESVYLPHMRIVCLSCSRWLGHSTNENENSMFETMFVCAAHAVQHK